MVKIEKTGKPGLMISCRPFAADAGSAAASEGMPDLRGVTLSAATTANRPTDELKRVARSAAPEVVGALTGTAPAMEKTELFRSRSADELSFSGRDVIAAMEGMEKYFLANRCSDGFPLVPPTREAVGEMIRAADLPPDHVVGIVDPKRGVATVEKVAVNAVMAGCRPAYFPMLLTIVQALTDPAFDLYGVQCTGGLTAPMVVVSGPIIQELNLNFSYSTAGPGWKANSTIGRAMRLILINLGHGWPGLNDMKDVGNPAKFGIVIAENEIQNPPGWSTLREREGYGKEVSTVSVYACQSFRQIHDSQKYMPTRKPLPIVDPLIARLMGSALNSTAEQWGEEMLVVLSPVMANILAGQGYTPETVSRELYEKGRIRRDLFGPRPLGSFAVSSGIPSWIEDLPDDGMVPVVPNPEDIKIVVSGGRGPGTGFLVDRWGFGNSHFVTKEIRLPSVWEDLVEGLNGWKTPIEVK
ncbi:MAG: hypothetical protein RBT20_00460 [Syntrophales bacterium]|nr:hypothetical protein [Syntrophales bacterium]